MSDKKKTIFIDWHNTLSTDLFFSSYAHNNQGLPLRKAFYDSVLNYPSILHDWLRGGLNSEQIIQRVAQHAQLDFDVVWPLFVKDCETIALAPSLADKLIRLKEKYHTILVTDNMDCFNRFTVPSQNLLRYFHSISNSCDCKLMKEDKDGKIFSQLAQQRNITISDCILIDDREDVSQIFTQLGGTTYRVENPQHTTRVLDELLAA
jgi:FMN phosphatase YigB (HAD superfamily)